MRYEKTSWLQLSFLGLQQKNTVYCIWFKVLYTVILCKWITIFPWSSWVFFHHFRWGLVEVVSVEEDPHLSDVGTFLMGRKVGKKVGEKDGKRWDTYIINIHIYLLYMYIIYYYIFFFKQGKLPEKKSLSIFWKNLARKGWLTRILSLSFWNPHFYILPPFHQMFDDQHPSIAMHIFPTRGLFFFPTLAKEGHHNLRNLYSSYPGSLWKFIYGYHWISKYRLFAQCFVFSLPLGSLSVLLKHLLGDFLEEFFESKNDIRFG